MFCSSLERSECGIPCTEHNSISGCSICIASSVLCVKMDMPDYTKDQAIRLSSSPANALLVIQNSSPVESIHPGMGSPPRQLPEAVPHTSGDFGMRTADFFEYSSDEDENDDDNLDQPGTTLQDTLEAKVASTDIQLLSSAKKDGNYLGGSDPAQIIFQCGEKALETRVFTDQQDFIKLTSTPPVLELPPHIPHHHQAENSGSTWGSSIEEMATAYARPVNIKASGPGKIVYNASPRVSVQNLPPSPRTPAAFEDSIHHSLGGYSKRQQIIDAHTLTLQAILQDDEGVTETANRLSREMLRGVTESRIGPESSSAYKRVHVVPPPIDTSQSPRNLPKNIVRTPYPYQSYKRSVLSHPSPLSTTAPDSPIELVLTLRIRRHGQTLSLNIARLIIPAVLDIKTVKAKIFSKNEKIFEAIDFDDSCFFRELRKIYARLAGSWRFFSARTLSHIAIASNETCFSKDTVQKCTCTCSSYASPNLTASVPHQKPPNPIPSIESKISTEPLEHQCSHQSLTADDLTDNFSLAKLMEHYHHPHRGKACYSWVRWAQRLSTNKLLLPAPLTFPSPHEIDPEPKSSCTIPLPDSAAMPPFPCSRTTPESGWRECSCTTGSGTIAGLEFVEGWSWMRILAVTVVLLLLAVAATAVWVCLGPGGFDEVGRRVGTGLVVGILVLLIGLIGVGGWVWVSWLIV